MDLQLGLNTCEYTKNSNRERLTEEKTSDGDGGEVGGGGGGVKGKERSRVPPTPLTLGN